MSAQANPKLALAAGSARRCAAARGNLSRQHRGADQEDYSEAQRGVWAAAADDEAAFAERLWQGLTLIATLGGSPVGFVSLKGTEELDLLYVHPAVAGQGDRRHAVRCARNGWPPRAAGSSSWWMRATPRAASSSTAVMWASVATPCCGGDEWLATTTMEKKLTPKEKPAMTKPDTPFPRHWLYYIALKYAVIVAAVLLALYVAYRVS